MKQRPPSHRSARPDRAGSRPERPSTRPDRSSTRPGDRSDQRPDHQAERRPDRLADPKIAEAALRLRRAAELLEEINEARAPADRVKTRWFRDHPEVTGVEHARIDRMVDDVLRQRPAIDWWLDRHDVRIDGRARLVASEILLHRHKPGRLPPLPAILRGLAEKLAGQEIDHPEMPPAVRLAVPEWLLAKFAARFGPDLAPELAALARPALLDLRINTLKGNQAAAIKKLGTDGITAEPTPFSPVGLRAKGGDLGSAKALTDGLIEAQDEGSQLAALLVEAAAGQTVVDFCAGAGGKTLALAAQMNNRGRLFALDSSEGRLQRARLRLRRAGAGNAEARAIEPKWLKRHKGTADRVLVDAPCTGTGVWRRKPDARWRLKASDLEALLKTQDDLLDRAAPLVKPGGRLIYVTCSLLLDENEARVEAFLARHPDFTLEPIGAIWRRVVGSAPPSDKPTLLLTPARHGTDGFFVAVLSRKSA